MIQDILDQLSGLGIEGFGGYEGLGNITSQQVSDALSQSFDISQQDLPSSLFQPITGLMLAGGRGKTQSGAIQATGSTLLSDLRNTLYGGDAQKAYGGFAGGSQQSRFQKSARDVYGKGMTDVLGQAYHAKRTGLQSIQDIINQWRETALKIKGDL